MGGKPLGYNIKYITRPGNKTPTLFYEVKPGEWLPRSKIPEILELSFNSSIYFKTSFSEISFGYLITSELIPASLANFSLFFT